MFIFGFSLFCVLVLGWAFRKAKAVEEREAALRGHFPRNPQRGNYPAENIAIAQKRVAELNSTSSPIHRRAS